MTRWLIERIRAISIALGKLGVKVYTDERDIISFFKRYRSPSARVIGRLAIGGYAQSPDFVVVFPNGKAELVECEIKSSSFIAHRHNPKRVDYCFCAEADVDLSIPSVEIPNALAGVETGRVLLRKALALKGDRRRAFTLLRWRSSDGKCYVCGNPLEEGSIHKDCLTAAIVDTVDELRQSKKGIIALWLVEKALDDDTKFKTPRERARLLDEFIEFASRFGIEADSFIEDLERFKDKMRRGEDLVGSF